MAYGRDTPYEHPWLAVGHWSLAPRLENHFAEPLQLARRTGSGASPQTGSDRSGMLCPIVKETACQVESLGDNVGRSLPDKFQLEMRVERRARSQPGRYVRKSERQQR